MAQLMMCDSCHEQEGTVVWTLIKEGEVTAYCPGCFAGACGAVAREAGVLDQIIGEAIAGLVASGDLKEVKRRKIDPVAAGADLPVEAAAPLGGVGQAGAAGTEES